jgi:hypothetical protein
MGKAQRAHQCYVPDGHAALYPSYISEFQLIEVPLIYIAKSIANRKGNVHALLVEVMDSPI